MNASGAAGPNSRCASASAAWAVARPMSCPAGARPRPGHRGGRPRPGPPRPARLGRSRCRPGRPGRSPRTGRPPGASTPRRGPATASQALPRRAARGPRSRCRAARACRRVRRARRSPLTLRARIGPGTQGGGRVEEVGRLHPRAPLLAERRVEHAPALFDRQRDDARVDAPGASCRRPPVRSPAGCERSVPVAARCRGRGRPRGRRTRSAASASSARPCRPAGPRAPGPSWRSGSRWSSGHDDAGKQQPLGEVEAQVDGGGAAFGKEQSDGGQVGGGDAEPTRPAAQGPLGPSGLGVERGGEVLTQDEARRADRVSRRRPPARAAAPEPAVASGDAQRSGPGSRSSASSSSSARCSAARTSSTCAAQGRSVGDVHAGRQGGTHLRIPGRGGNGRPGQLIGEMRARPGVHADRQVDAGGAQRCRRVEEPARQVEAVAGPQGHLDLRWALAQPAPPRSR